MAIIGTLPNNILNGQAVDANPVMADFNFIVNQVNANANPLGTLTAPSGTVMPFAQASAPLGWTAATDAVHNDAVMRCVNPASYTGTQGANAVGPLFVGGAATDGHALTTAELAVHSHATTENPHSHSSPGHQHGTASGANFWTNTSGSGNFGGGATAINLETLTNAVAVTINPNTTGLSVNNAGSGTAHSHTLTNFNYKIVDYILCTKS